MSSGYLCGAPTKKPGHPPCQIPVLGPWPCSQFHGGPDPETARLWAATHQRNERSATARRAAAAPALSQEQERYLEEQEQIEWERERLREITVASRERTGKVDVNRDRRNVRREKKALFQQLRLISNTKSRQRRARRRRQITRVTHSDWTRVSMEAFAQVATFVNHLAAAGHMPF